MTRIEKRLSVMNRTPASQTSLAFGRPTISRSELIRKHRKYEKLYAGADAVDPPWCSPYVQMMGALVDEVKVRGR